jgi:hypothetical protein
MLRAGRAARSVRAAELTTALAAPSSRCLLAD